MGKRYPKIVEFRHLDWERLGDVRNISTMSPVEIDDMSEQLVGLLDSSDVWRRPSLTMGSARELGPWSEGAASGVESFLAGVVADGWTRAVEDFGDEIALVAAWAAPGFSPEYQAVADTISNLGADGMWRRFAIRSGLIYSLDGWRSLEECLSGKLYEVEMAAPSPSFVRIVHPMKRLSRAERMLLGAPDVYGAEPAWPEDTGMVFLHPSDVADLYERWRDLGAPRGKPSSIGLADRVLETAASKGYGLLCNIYGRYWGNPVRHRA